jgi:UDP-4-amino-4,6-dideoxy-N-acetyl-beta-L-altrosamine N-acetyltransferase
LIDPSRIRLRPLAAADRDGLLVWRNSERVRRNMYTDHIIGAEEHRRWFERALEGGAAAHFIFALGDRSLGLVSFTAIANAHERCSWAFYLGEAGAPRGAGAAMEYLALCHAFEAMGIRKLCCEVFAFNESVIGLHEKFGFVREGRLAQHCRKNGRLEDVVCLARFRDGWEKDKPAYYARCFGRAGAAP